MYTYNGSHTIENIIVSFDYDVADNGFYDIGDIDLSFDKDNTAFNSKGKIGVFEFLRSLIGENADSSFPNVGGVESFIDSNGDLEYEVVDMESFRDYLADKIENYLQEYYEHEPHDKYDGQIGLSAFNEINTK